MTAASGTRSRKTARSLSVAVPAAIFLFGAISVGLLAWMQLDANLRAMYEAAADSARLNGLSTVGSLEAALRRHDQPSARSAVERTNTARNLDWAVYIDPDGVVQYASSLALRGPADGQAALRRIREQAESAARTRKGRVWREAADNKMLCVFPVHFDAGVGSFGGSRVGVMAQQFDLDFARRSVVRDTLRQSSIAGALLLLLSGFLWLFLRRRLLRRIDRLWAFAESFEREVQPQSVDVTGDDEIGQLGRRLEQMASTISERTRLLRESQKLDVMGRMALSIAHDFNNMLTVILGNASLALAESESVDQGAELRRRLTDIEDAASSAAALTRRLLAFSRKAPLHREVLDPSQAITGLARLLQRLVGASYQVEFDLVATPAVEMDRSELEQVVFNLVVNARDSMPAGGRIRIRCHPVAPKNGERVSWVQISVVDQGVGIPLSDAARIFEPFFTSKPLGQGTGLGLATVRAILQGVGGRVEFDSDAGVGTTFRVFLPTTEAAVQEQPGTVGAAPPQALRAGVMVCEAEPTIRRVAADLLRQADMEVVECGTGAAALRHLEDPAWEGRVAVIGRLPGVAGARQLGQQIRDRRPEMRIVFLVGAGDDPVLVPDGAPCQLVAKPIDPVALLAAVAR